MITGMLPSTEELLSVVLGKTVAKRIRSEHVLRKLRLATVSEMTESYGLSDRAAVRMVAVLELCRRIEASPLSRGDRISSAEDVYQFARRKGLSDLMVEQFWIILLDAKNQFRDDVMISQGSLTTSPVHPREVFCPAIRSRAAGVILLHNHPSGDPTPSTDDVEITERLGAVARLVGIDLLDHVIVAHDSYSSLNLLGFIPRSMMD